MISNSFKHVLLLSLLLLVDKDVNGDMEPMPNQPTQLDQLHCSLRPSAIQSTLTKKLQRLFGNNASPELTSSLAQSLLVATGLMVKN
jgi:hypothetical protein